MPHIRRYMHVTCAGIMFVDLQPAKAHINWHWTIPQSPAPILLFSCSINQSVRRTVCFHSTIHEWNLRWKGREWHTDSSRQYTLAAICIRYTVLSMHKLQLTFKNFH